MITTKVNPDKKENRSEKYPRLMENSGVGVVLALSQNKNDSDCFEGFVLTRGNEKYPLGHESHTWRHVVFEEYFGEVTLRNEP